MNLKQAIAGIGAVVVIGALFFFFGGNNETTRPAPMTDSTTFTNPIVFEDTVDVEGALRARVNDVTITTDTTLTVAQSGSDIYIGTAGVDLTLPAAATAAGVEYRVIVSAAFATTNMTVVTSGGENLVFGSLEVAGAVVLCSAEDSINFVNTAELPGDWVQLRSNGTNWYLTGQAGASGGITCTAT